MSNEDLAAKLRRLAAAMGVGMAGFDPPVSTASIEVFERANGVRLPEQYRWFVSHIASGGPGPGNGLLSFRANLVDERLGQAWIDPVLWNETDGEGEDDGGVYDGVLAVADLGCGMVAILPLSGPHRGEVWHDLAGDGFARVAGSYVEWYERWVDDKLQQLAARAADEARALDERYAAVLADPDDEDALRNALYGLGHARDARFEEVLQRAIEAQWLSVTAAPTIVDDALALGLGDAMLRLLDDRIAEEDSGESTFRSLRAVVLAALGRVAQARAEWSTAQSAPGFEPPPRSACRVALALLAAGDLAGAIDVYVDADGWVCAEPLHLIDEAVASGTVELVVPWCVGLVERLESRVLVDAEVDEARGQADDDELDEPDEFADDDGFDFDFDEDEDEDELAERVADAHYATAMALTHLGRAADAEPHLLEAQAHVHIDWARLALWACEAGDYDASLRHLERAAAKPWWEANLRGCCLQGLARSAEALAAFEESLGHRNWIVPYENRSYSLVHLGRTSEARALLDEVEQFAPEFAWTHYHRATLYAREGAVEQARASFQRAIALGFAEASATDDALRAILHTPA